MSLSKTSGVAYTTIRSMIERDLSGASIDNLLLIGKALNMDAAELADPEGWAKKKAEREDIQTIAAHHDGGDWTEEELEEIERFKEFVRMKKQRQQE
ncbi:hypothetical protein DFP95_12123 [Cohnella lupini]|uniref:HTH cro/C1-type domain-containing protein n=2 Tax=Cohnella lupini TaxID=1294267 RepID=A0A3D9HZ37_9BACL|nr:hypothetical protein DFP95_12123 [Cohnella lupini]